MQPEETAPKVNHKKHLGEVKPNPMEEWELWYNTLKQLSQQEDNPIQWIYYRLLTHRVPAEIWTTFYRDNGSILT